VVFELPSRAMYAVRDPTGVALVRCPQA
jgi:hypothetical protein